MQIKIEIDVKPEELRRFLGIPDVSGLQEDVINFLRDKVGAAGDVDLSGMVKSNFDALRNTAAWKNIVGKVRINPGDEEPQEKPRSARARRAKKEPGSAAS